MSRYYRSALSETKSEEQWGEWSHEFYKNLGIDRPIDWFKFISKFLKLEEVTAHDSYSQYPEANREWQPL